MSEVRSNLTDTGATSAVVTAAEFKTHARIYHTQDDTYIATLILSATQVIEHETRRALINRAFTLQLQGFPSSGEIILPRSPLSTVTDISYETLLNTLTLDSSKYHTYSVNGVGRVVLRSTGSWPTTLNTGALDVSVEFTAGYGATSASVPAALRHAVLLQATHMYENRTSVNIGNIVNEIPMTVQRLIVQYHTGDYQ